MLWMLMMRLLLLQLLGHNAWPSHHHLTHGPLWLLLLLLLHLWLHGTAVIRWWLMHATHRLGSERMLRCSRLAGRSRLAHHHGRMLWLRSEWLLLLLQLLAGNTHRMWTLLTWSTMAHRWLIRIHISFWGSRTTILTLTNQKQNNNNRNMDHNC